jgi:hypothetical protein
MQKQSHIRTGGTCWYGRGTGEKNAQQNAVQIAVHLDLQSQLP